MERFTNIVLVVSAIIIPGCFISTLLDLDFWLKVPTSYFGTITVPNFVAGAVFFWFVIALIYGIYDLTKTGIKKLKKMPN